MVLKPVTHCIFDLDGTLLDTETVYSQVISDIAKRFNKVYTPEIRSKLLGTVEKDTCRICVEEMELPITPEEFFDEYKARCKKSMRGIPLLPGVEKLVRHLASHNIPIAIGTSSSDQMVALKTKHLKEFFDLFHHKVMGSSDPEVKHGKPSPDIFLVCASRFDDKPDPEKCLVFEDAPNGAQAAISAKMQVVHIPDSAISRDLCKMSTLVLDSMADFQPELFGLPPYNSN